MTLALTVVYKCRVSSETVNIGGRVTLYHIGHEFFKYE